MTTDENKNAGVATDSAQTSGSAYNVFRDWGTKFHKSVDTEEDAWEAIGELRFGEGYEVRDEYGNIRQEFVPF